MLYNILTMSVTHPYIYKSIHYQGMAGMLGSDDRELLKSLQGGGSTGNVDDDKIMDSLLGGADVRGSEQPVTLSSKKKEEDDDLMASIQQQMGSENVQDLDIIPSIEEMDDFMGRKSSAFDNAGTASISDSNIPKGTNTPPSNSLRQTLLSPEEQIDLQVS